MKRTVALFMIFIAIFCLSACTKKSNDSDTESRPVVVLPENVSSTITIEVTESEPESISYIGNKNSKIYHKVSCKSVASMKDENKIAFATEDEALENNYKPCGSCLK